MHLLYLETRLKLKKQKEKLEKQENFDYYIDIIKKKSVQLKSIDRKKEKVFGQFAIFFKQVQEEQLKLLEQSHQLKLQLLEFKAIEDENAFGSKVRNNNSENKNKEEEKKKIQEEKRKKELEQQQKLLEEKN